MSQEDARYDESLAYLESKEVRTETETERIHRIISEIASQTPNFMHSSVDAATAPSPSQNVGQQQTQNDTAGMVSAGRQTSRYCIACGSIYHTAPSCPQNNLNLATARKLRQLDALLPEAQKSFDSRARAATRASFDYIDKCLAALQSRLDAISSDVPAAAAPSSPEFLTQFCEEMIEWKAKVERLLNTQFSTSDQTFVNHATRLTALEATRQQTVPAYGSTHQNGPVGAPKVAVVGAWIACSERMPDPDNTEQLLLLAYAGDKYVAIGRCRWNPRRENWWEDHSGRIISVTHWQPLPAPPTAI